MEELVIGVDPGSYNTKIAGPYGVEIFVSNIDYEFDSKESEEFGPDDMRFSINGKEGIAGTIARYETVFGVSSMYGESKANEDTKTRVLLAIHRYITTHKLNIDTVSMVVGQPVKHNTIEEKAAMINMLAGPNNVTVNGITHVIKIKDVAVVPEGGAAFWSVPQKERGRVQIIDCGSGTINAVGYEDQLHINSRSDTFDFGMETVRGATVEQVAKNIIQHTTLLHWDKDAPTLVCGESANDMNPFIKKHFTNSEVLTPIIEVSDGTEIALHPVFANAVGNYNLAKFRFAS